MLYASYILIKKPKPKTFIEWKERGVDYVFHFLSLVQGLCSASNKKHNLGNLKNSQSPDHTLDQLSQNIWGWSTVMTNFSHSYGIYWV